MTRIFDITRTISRRTHVWPGDTSYAVRQLLAMSDDASVNLLTLTISPHTGTHADAYFHYIEDGDRPAQMPLDAYIGRARVVTVDQAEGPLLPQHFSHVDLEGGERLLIHSHASGLADDAWPERIVYPDERLIAHLAQLGYRLIGLDSPSTDAFDSKILPSHRALWEHGMVNLEHLQLRDVPDGDYELIALPLKLEEACASPVRAILRSLPQALVG